MTPPRSRRLSAVCIRVALGLAISMSARAQTAPDAGAAGGAAGGINWPTDYDAASLAARQNNRPLLVIFGAPWCEACHDLAQQLKSPDAQKELAGVDRVYVDLDGNHDLARKLGVGPIPALRVVKPSGGIAGVWDGTLPAAELTHWLQDAKKSAAQTTFDASLDADDLSDSSVAKVVAMFGDADAAVREAAIRRLLPHREKAAAPVVEAFAKGSLAERLSALDLLDSWRAPIDQLDPWRADTITEARVAALRNWSKDPGAAATNPALDPRQLAEVHDTLAQYIQSADSDAVALRERLARFGTALLPEIYAGLKQASTDQARERLTLLRYRVAASDALAMQWPAGLEKLASPQVKDRHAALDELSSKVTARDTSLLLELFSDPDVLVRETALRLLQKVGGPSATDALANLLADPDPNVRAAVLKSAAEASTPQLTAKIADYALHEADVDLVVHAARVLRNAKSPTATKTLYTLLDHASWRVRAEAAEALTEKAGGRSDATPAQQADFFVRMLDLLNDPDGFVASRALSALEGVVRSLPNVEKIAAAAEKHPELAAKSIKIIAANFRSDPKAVTYVPKFLKHPDPAVRAAAIGNLGEVMGASSADDLHHALADADERVRIAASDAVTGLLAAQVPEQRETFVDDAPTLDYELFLINFHKGKNRPEWLNAFRPDLEKLLDAASKKEQMHAAIPLVALGYPDKALPLIISLAQADPAQLQTAAAAMAWLTFGDRLALFKTLKEHASASDLSYLARGLAVGNDPRIADAFWALLSDPKADWGLADDLEYYLRRLTLGNSYYSETTAAQKRDLVQSLSRHLTAEGDIPRTMALAMMASIDPLAATNAAVKLRNDPASSDALKRDALQIQMSLLPRGDAESSAADLLATADPSTRSLLLAVLTGNSEAVNYLHGRLYIERTSRYNDYAASGTPIVPLPPKGLQIDQVKPLLQDKNPLVAAQAGYLLALLKDNSGMPTLLDYFQKNSTDHDYVCRMVYRAITALDDDTRTPVLNDIYKTLAKSGSSELREFYWTIRSMTGDKCLELRKHIRDEVGMDILR